MTVVDQISGSSAALAEFYSKFSLADAPAKVIKHARQHFLDTIGVCLGGGAAEHVQLVTRVLHELRSCDGSTVIGHDFRANLDEAIFANAVMGHSIDFDDGHKFLHPGCVIVPVALGVAEHYEVSGRRLLEALITGYDASIRISLAGGTVHRSRGFHPTGTCNFFGAAIAAGKIMGLTAEGMGNALGIAAGQASGLTQYRANGAPTKHLNSGFAARGGLMAARLAAVGYAGGIEPLEGEFGFLNLYVGDYDPDALTADLGQRYMVAETDFKPYPSCRQTHAPVDLAIEAVTKLRVDPIRVVSGTLWTYRYASEKPWMTTSKPPVNSLAAMLSIPFCVASAMSDGHLTLSSFDPKPLVDPARLTLAAKLRVVHDEALTSRWPDERGARLELTLDDGRHVSLTATNPRGGNAAPLADEEITSKFLSMAEPVIGSRAVEFVDRTETIEHVGNAADITVLLRK